MVDSGVFSLRQGKLAAAKASFEVAWDLAALPAALDGLGSVALLEGEVGMAEQYFESAHRLDDTYVQSLANLALIYEYRGEYARALELFREVLKSDPANEAVRNNYAVSLFEQEKVLATKLVMGELLRAAALSKHPVIKHNQRFIEVSKESQL